MTSSEAAFYAERIAQKEHEFNDLQTAFNKYKLKNSVKFDHLRKEITLYCNNHGLPIVEKENNALLLLRLAEMENALEVTRRDAESLHHELSRRQIQMNDQFILIKNLEEQLHVASPLSSAELEERKRALQNIDLDIVHQQMIYKDERIVELNNVILDKERQILDLQEMCREQGEVANSKTQAMRIVQKKFEVYNIVSIHAKIYAASIYLQLELENRGHREVATETDNWLWMQQHIQRREREPIVNGVNRANSGRSQSPGHAVANRSGSSSPPPLDPSEAENKAAFIREDDEDLMGLPTFQGKNLDQEASLRKKQRKRVTFDLPPAASRLELDMVTANDEIAITLHHLSDENLQLRKELNEQTTSMVDSELTRVVREGKAQSLKARAVAQGRIKDLEDRMAEFNQQHSAQVDRLQTEIETLRSTREWEVEQNAKLREQITQIRDKNHKLTEELDASEQANRDTELKVIQGEELMERMVEDLAEAESIIRYMEEQKHSILDDVDSLKEALIAQDQFIEILEADIVIYEEHIGILRESLGASKVDHRSLIRSKAFETKLKALEKEKEQIDRRSSGEA
uniref:Coiled-coil domain-containing protein 176 n=1 Tax=Heterorhabditis bacteriophora TaxID=37862 RepID=A0A1I7WXJ4_HETBA